jgi:type I restriction enzyme S subunit
MSQPRYRPYPEYKDLRVPWLREIPVHWKTHTLKRIASVRLSGVDKHSIEGEIPVRLCNYTDVYYKKLITPDLEFVHQQLI